MNTETAYSRSLSLKSDNSKSAPPSLWLRLALCLLAIALSGALFYLLGNRLTSQIYFTKANSAFKDKYYWMAVQHFKKAISHQPKDVIFWRNLAGAYDEIGAQEVSIQRAFLSANQAKKAYLEANQLRPLDATVYFGLAKSESRLQKLYTYLYPGNTNNPFDPLPYYKSAIKFRPNSITYHFALARYLHQTGKNKDLLQVTQSLARIYPGVYELLKREPLWSDDIQAAVKKGLQEATIEGIAVKEAHRSLAYALSDESNWSDAIHHFEETLSYQREISARDYIQLGGLYLYNNLPEEAIVNFIRALMISPEKEKDLSTIAQKFNNKTHQNEFSMLYQEIENNFFLSPEMQIIAAKKFIDLKLLDKARAVLTAVNELRQNGEAYYWLAKIAEIEKDWDAMEINIQKATVLEPTNKHYHNIFTQLRKRLGKDKSKAKQISYGSQQ